MGVQLQHGHSHGLGGGHGHSHGGSKKSKKKNASHVQATSTPCSDSPSQRIEGGVAYAPEDAELPGGGLPTFSYQNTKLVDPTQDLEIAAVLAENGTRITSSRRTGWTRGRQHECPGSPHPCDWRCHPERGSFVAAGVIYFWPEYSIVDPICTFVFSIIVLFTTFTIMKDALLVSLTGFFLNFL